MAKNSNQHDKVLSLSNGDRLSYYSVDGSTPTVVFLPGYRSVMTGTKALALQEYCAATGRAFCKFDYRGHGTSTGDFMTLTLSDWIHDANSILNHVGNDAPIVLVGSSMGAWIALHLALRRPTTIAGIVGVAPAIDFTHDLLSTEEKQQVDGAGVVWRPSVYNDGPYPFTKVFVEDSKKWFLLHPNDESTDPVIPIEVPVRLLHGKLDEEIPWTKSMELAVKIPHAVVSLIENGDHRLSRPTDVQAMIDAMEDLLREYNESERDHTLPPLERE